MDYQPENNKSKNWLYRLRHLKLNLNDKSHVSKLDHEVYDGETEDRTNKSRSSFRKSLKKMHSRIKKCTSKQKVDISTVSRLSSNILDLSSSEITDLVEETISNTLTNVGQNAIVELQYKQNLEEHPGRVPCDEIFSLSMYYWYWGPLTSSEAEEKLQHAPDGAFLIRDSSSTSYLFSISFRSVGKTLHSRIEHNSRGRYSLYDQEGYKTIAELVENAIKISEKSVYCYSRLMSLPVRLTTPISRYTQVRSLKYLCRFVIRQCTNINDIPKLPLPTVLYSYLQEGPYF